MPRSSPAMESKPVTDAEIRACLKARLAGRSEHVVDEFRVDGGAARIDVTLIGDRRLSDAIAKALHDCTQGMTWALTALLCKAQRRCLLEKRESMSAEDILKTFAHDAVEMHPLVQAMATRNAGLLAKFQDLYHPAFDRKQVATKAAEMELLQRLGVQPKDGGSVKGAALASNDDASEQAA